MSYGAKVTGKLQKTTLSTECDFQSILTLLRHKLKKRISSCLTSLEIDVLIGTDCISEGQNLRIVIVL